MSAPIRISITCLVASNILIASATEKAADTPPFHRLQDRVSVLATKPFPSPADRQRLEQNIDELAKRYPGDPWTMYWQGRLAERKGDSASARAYWQKALAAHSRLAPLEDSLPHARAHQRLGEDCLGKNDLPGALAHAKAAQKLAPAEAEGYQLEWDARLALGDLAPLERHLRRAAHHFGGSSSQLLGMYWELLSVRGDWKALQDELARRPKGWDFLVLHFQAMMDEMADQPAAAWAGHYLASQLGPVGGRWTRRSRHWLETHPAAPQKEAGRYPFANAYRLAGRKSMAGETLNALPKGTMADSNGEVARAMLETEAHSLLGHPAEVARIAAEVSRRHPGFAPLLVREGEAREALGQPDEAARLFADARSRASACSLVARLNRMGAEFVPAPDGATAKSVQPDSPWGDAGLCPGDTVLALDGQRLAGLPIAERMQAVRQFQGGKAEFRTKDGERLTREMELVLFDE